MATTATVLIATYNYAGFIGQAVASLLQQNYPPAQMEIIVVDDGSSDNTRKVLEKPINTGQVQYHYQLNAGKAAATRKGIEMATGEIIFNLDADDYFISGKIEKTLALFERDASLVHVASPAMIVYDNGRPHEIEQIPGEWLDRTMKGVDLLRFFFSRKQLFGGGSTFAARASVLKNMVWDDAIDMYTDEWFLIETLLKGNSYLLSEPLSVWRVHGSNYSGQHPVENKWSKQQRLERSSAAILQMLNRGNYPKWLKKQYRLKHEVRKMVWKEERGTKHLKDIFRFIPNVIFSGNSWSVLQRYHAFNRLLPTGVLKWLKR